MSQNNESAFEILKVNGVEFSHDDLFRVVHDFYGRIQDDPVLKIPFASVADWPEHIENLTHFWWIRFGGKPYRFSLYNPVGKHFFAGFNQELLTRWLSIFHATLDKNLTPQQAALWKVISERIGESLLIKNDLFKQEFESKK